MNPTKTSEESNRHNLVLLLYSLNSLIFNSFITIILDFGVYIYFVLRRDQPKI
jgi:hypothetical protein